MKDIWQTLEERTRAWSAIGRQTLAEAIWRPYVTVRFGRTGDPRALEYLYPYLNHHDTATRFQALEAAAQAFEGRGPKALTFLDYFVNNPDHFIRDRAVQVVGATMTGMRADMVLGVLGPYLDHRNRFIRKQALVALGKACAEQADERVLATIQRVAAMGGPREDEKVTAIARLYSGKATGEIYSVVANPRIAGNLHSSNSDAVAILVRNGADEWYQRACEEIFHAQMHITPEKAHQAWQTIFIWRAGAGALIAASPRRGIQALEKMLHLAGHRTPGHQMYKSAPGLFAGADPEMNFDRLIDLLKKGDVPVQRIAAVCLGRLMLDTQDEKATEVLRDLCNSRNKALQAAALRGLGMVARSSGDQELRKICLERMMEPETAVDATMALGMVFLGSSHPEVFHDLYARARVLREQPVKGRQYSKPLAACYGATGLLFLGTGSIEPLEFLVDVLSRPRVAPFDAYHWWAGHSLVMIEFPESALGLEFIGIDEE